jgi:hypothetical protein
MEAYEEPRIRELGHVATVTLGQFFSRVDGNSGSAGNRGQGKGGTASSPR